MGDDLPSIKNMSQKYHKKLMLPRDSGYIIRCIKDTFSQSKSSDNPMITLEFEIQAPEEVEIGGEMYNIAGYKTQPRYFVTDNGVPADLEKKRNEAGLVYAQFGLANPTDWANPELGFAGKVVAAMLYAKPKEERKTPTQAQIDACKGTNKKPEGDVMVNPLTKQPLISYEVIVGEIFGLAPEPSFT